MVSPIAITLSVMIGHYILAEGTLEVSLVNTFTTRADAVGYRYFTCYVSDSDRSDVTVESRRVSDTQTSGVQENNRPPNFPRMEDGGYRIYLSNYLNGAFGVFACDVSRANGDTTSIQTILLRSNAHIVPTNMLLTVTVNKGDPQIVLEMDERVRSQNEAIWRKDGGLALSRNTFSLNVPVSGGTITTSDGGVYECHHNKRRDNAVHGLQRLIVRACPADHWGPPNCFGICDNCYNGGICDDTTGECICPAGFHGPNCLSACGSEGHYGKNCEYQCTGNSDHLYCRRLMICLPDPFGCRCTTGFEGLDCFTSCTFPNFGANCLETCHCASGVDCNRYTGVCSNGRCGGGYTGNNCQIPPTCKLGYYGSECLLKCHCKNNAACDRVTGRCDQGCEDGFTVRQGAENCEACNIGYYGNNCEEECHCTGGCHNVIGTNCDPSLCKTPWINWRPEPCQTGIADITVTKVNPGAPVQVTCTVESRNFLSSVTAFLSLSERYQPSNDITPVSTRTISATSKTREFRVSNVVREDVFYCSLGSSRSGVINAGRYYRRKAAEFYVLPELPDAPQSVSVSSMSVSINWRAWVEGRDRGDPPVIGYVAYHRRKNASDWMRGVIDYSSSLSEQFDSLESDTVYQFSVAALRNGSFGEGPRSPPLSIKTTCPVPEASPFNVRARLIEEEGSNIVNITWEIPEKNFLPCSTGVTGFTVRINDVDDTTILYTESMNGTSQLWHTQRDLEGGKNYSVQVKLKTEGGESPLSDPSDEARVFVPVPDDGEKEDVEEMKGTGGEQKGTGSSLLWLPIVLIVVILLAVVLVIVVVRRRRNYLGDKVPQHASYPDMPQNEPAVQERGLNGKMSDLPSSNGEETIPLRATTSKPSPDIPEWTADPRDEDDCEMDYQKDVDNIYGNLQRPTAVKVEDFPNYVATKTLSKTDSLIHEFMILAKDANYPCSVGAKEENKKKNRFRNMLPYDHSRVVLDLLPDDPHSDYYNASYMLDQNDAVAFIASQGPNKASTCDFWRMLWKEDVSIVVMVTNLFENGKERCAQYWPEKEGKEKKWGQITVTWTGTESYANHLVREMTMSKDDEQRTVSQYHFTTWPDMDVPREPTSLITLVQQVKAQNKGKNAPVLVHCSAGIGRTGTFIALYCLMDVLKSRKSINVYEFVEKMRKNRINMVQTPVQYQFLCDALAEVYQTGHIEIPSGLLQNLDLRSKRTTLLEEFQLLNKLSRKVDVKCSVGQDPENAAKNRFPDVYPPDENRPFVSSDRNFGENDYINATFVNTYTKKDAFITAQAPLPNTIEAFWRMICDWRVPLIIMLNQLTKADKTCPCYWPRRGTQSYGSATVTLAAEENKGAFIHRQFEISVTSAQNTCSVDHFQLLAWPEEGEAATGLAQLLEASQLILNHYTKEPAVIHCIDGVGRSGVLVTIKSEIERLRREDKVNIFQSARQLRNSNPLFMADQEHYLTCYKLLQSWLNAAPEYGNI